MAVTTFSYFDAMLCGFDLCGFDSDGVEEITDKHAALLNNLIEHVLNENNENNEKQMILLDPYIISCFKCFIQSKRDIVIDYGWLSQEYVNCDVRNLVVNELHESQEFKVIRDGDDLRNSINARLLSVFKKLESITVITSSNSHYHRSLSMDLLLSMISNIGSLERVVILSKFTPSWQSYLWQTSSLALMEKFKESKYGIQLKYEIQLPDDKFHGFVISKE